MDSKNFIAIFAFIFAVNCQLNVQQEIEQTQYLQQVEKYGTNFTNRINNIYPLTNLSDAQRSNLSNQSGPSYGLNNSSRAFPPPYNSTERFLNKTISSMSKGVCIMEVP
jgi:hypothetical protein